MQSGRRKLLIIGGVILGVLLIGVVGTKLLGKASSPDGVCRKLFAYVAKQDTTNSYGMLSSDLSSATSKSDWSDLVTAQAPLFSNASFKLNSQQNLSEGIDVNGNLVKPDKSKPTRWLLEYSLDSPAATATVNCTVSVSKTTTIDGFDVIPTLKGNQ